jgi:hypothetical protein
MPIVLKSASLDLLEPSGPVQACNGIALLIATHAREIRIYQMPWCRTLEDQVLKIIHIYINEYFV